MLVAEAEPGPAPVAEEQAASCPQCGYDLRGCLDARRCPECGLEIEPGAPRTRIPWAYRRRIGPAAAYVRTVRLATLHPRRLAAEVERPVAYRDALRFRLLTCLLATLPITALLVGVMAGYGGAGFLTVLHPDRIRNLMFAGPAAVEPGTPWAFGAAIPWESGATLPPVLPVALLVAFVLVGGVATYAFHPRRLPQVRQNRAVALGHYASAPLVFAPLPVGAFMVVAVLQQMALDAPGTGFPRLITLLTVFGCAAAVAVAFLFLRATLVLLRHAADARLPKLLLMTLVLPVAWTLCAAAALFGIPWLVGLVRLMLVSLRG
jgi:hypothetical protein